MNTAANDQSVNQSVSEKSESTVEKKGKVVAAMPERTSSDESDSQRVSQRQPSQLKSTVRSLANKDDSSSSGESNLSSADASDSTSSDSGKPGKSSGGGLSFASRKLTDVETTTASVKKNPSKPETSND